MADQYEKKFETNYDFFNTCIINCANHVINKYLSRKAVKRIDPNNSGEVNSVIKSFPNRKANRNDGITN